MSSLINATPRLPLRGGAVSVALVVVGAGLSWAVIHAGKKSTDSPRVLAPLGAAAARETAALKISAARWDERWRLWRAGLSTPGNNTQVAIEFEELMAAAPERALARAQQESDAARRKSLIQTVLLLWTETDPTAAAARARTLPEAERAIGIAAVLAGIANRPDLAVALADEFCRADPVRADVYGSTAIAALGRTGEYRAALHFAVQDHNLEAGETRTKWLRAAAEQWARQDPVEAMAAAQEAPDEAARFEALDAVVASRFASDPTRTAQTLQLLPPGSDRNVALGQALRNWVERDPQAAATWLAPLAPSPEFDAGAEAVAKQSQLRLHPQIALAWAEKIATSDVRSRTVSTVVQQWAITDAAAALRYAQSSYALLPGDRADLIAALTPSLQP